MDAPISELTLEKPITDRGRQQYDRHNTQPDGTPYHCGCRSCQIHRAKLARG